MNINMFEYILINNDTGVSKTLIAAPADWQDTTHRHFRSARYGTVLREDTLSLRFVLTGGAADEGGYYFLYDAYESKGIYANITCKRKRLNPFTNAYDERFIGKVDFSEASGWSFQEEWAEFKLIDSGKLAKVIARDEIDVNVFDTVSLDGVSITPFSNPYREVTAPKVDLPLQCISEGYFFGTEGIDIINTNGGSIFYDYRGETTTNEIGDRISINNPSVNSTIYTNSEELKQDSKLINIFIPYNINFSLVFNLVSGTVTYNYFILFRFRAYDASGTLISAINSATITAGGGTTSQTIPINSTGVVGILASDGINVPSGGKVEFNFSISIETFSINPFNLQVFTDLNQVTSYVRLEEFSFYEYTDGWPDNQIRGLFTHEVFTRLLQLYTSETDSSKILQSTILGKPDSEFQTYASKGYFADDFISNGYQFRQFVNRALNLNLNDSFKSLTTDKPIGLWYNKNSDYFEIEAIENYYKVEPFPIHLGEVTNFKISPARDYYFGNIKTGYPKTDDEDFQGVNEFNTETEHNSKTETKNSKDLRSRFIGSTVTIELTRRKNISKFATEDTKIDDKNILVATDGTTIIQGGLDSASGIININQYYNLTKTPRQRLKRQLRVYATTLYKTIGKRFAFGKSAKDTNIQYEDPTLGYVVSEFDDIDSSEFVQPLVWPEILEFDGIYTNEIEEEIANDPHRYFQCTALGREWYGYIDPDIVGKPFDGTATYKLIRMNENRLL